MEKLVSKNLKRKIARARARRSHSGTKAVAVPVKLARFPEPLRAPPCSGGNSCYDQDAMDEMYRVFSEERWGDQADVAKAQSFRGDPSVMKRYDAWVEWINSFDPGYFDNQDWLNFENHGQNCCAEDEETDCQRCLEWRSEREGDLA